MDLPVGCNFVVDKHAPATIPTFTGKRGGQEIPISAALVKKGQLSLRVDYGSICERPDVHEEHTLSWDVLELSLAGIQPQDQLFMDGQYATDIKPESTRCPAVSDPVCFPVDCEALPPAEDGGGCNSSGAGAQGAGLGLAMALLLRKLVRA